MASTFTSRFTKAIGDDLMHVAAKLLSSVFFLIILAGTVSAQTNIDEQIAAQQAAIQALQKEMAPRVQPLLIPNADIRLWLSKSVMPLVANFFNSLSAAQRQAQYQSTGQSGQLVN